MASITGVKGGGEGQRWGLAWIVAVSYQQPACWWSNTIQCLPHGLLYRPPSRAHGREVASGPLLILCQSLTWTKLKDVKLRYSTHGMLFWFIYQHWKVLFYWITKNLVILSEIFPYVNRKIEWPWMDKTGIFCRFSIDFPCGKPAGSIRNSSSFSTSSSSSDPWSCLSHSCRRENKGRCRPWVKLHPNSPSWHVPRNPHHPGRKRPHPLIARDS